MRHSVLALAAILALPCQLFADERNDANDAPTGSDSSALESQCDLSIQRVHELDEIQKAHGIDRPAVTENGTAWVARSADRSWCAAFDGRGMTVTPDDELWQFGLELTSFGVIGSELELVRPHGHCAEGRMLRYDWNSTLTEWWVNDAYGVEHGYTVHTRPAGAAEDDVADQLGFELRLRGDLTARELPGRRGVCLVDGVGVPVMHYDGLLAFDADGEILAAQITSSGNSIRIQVDAEGVRYPITIDPVIQSAYIKASNTNTSDVFGSSVAISGDTLVVGAYSEDSAATGVNGDQSSNTSPTSGAVYVFVRNGSSWQQEAYLKASNTDPGDRFGYSVAISGDTIVVGAYSEDSSATGVNGDQSSNLAADSGAVYVFVRTGSTWQQQAYLKASNAQAGDIFGTHVAIHGDTIVVGAIGEDSAATGVNGNQFHDLAGESGAAYVFVRNGTTWQQQAYLKASNTDPSDWFGISVAISMDSVVVGAMREESAAIGVNGNQASNTMREAGAAYLFGRTGTNWQQHAYLKASNTGEFDNFGAGVAIANNTIVVTAPEERSTATGINGNQSNNSAPRAGAAYVFARQGPFWTHDAYLKASNTGSSDDFGRSVAISDDTIIIGASGDASESVGINGDQTSDAYLRSGACYVFARFGTTWHQQAYVKASNTGAGDLFGDAVALDGNSVAIGARGEDSDAVGVGGNQASFAAPDSGAVYTFELVAPGTVGTNFCHPFAANTSGVAATITATGSTSVAQNSLTLAVSGLPLAGTTAMLINSLNASQVLLNPGGPVASFGRICIGGGAFGRHMQQLYMGNAGGFSAPIDLTALPYAGVPGSSSISVLPGETWYWQCWYRDGIGGQSNFSDAVAITFD
jgi:hypothetical protein